MSSQKTGRCMCGAVQISTDALGDEISACHCEMCTRWSGSAMMAMEVPADQVTVSGPVKTFRSSAFAERAWCDVCGSNLWIRDDGQAYELMPGLFDNAGGARLTRIVYADRAPEGWQYAGDVQRVSREEYEKIHPFVSEGEPT